MYRKFTTQLAGRELTLEFGKVAQLANGSCLVRYGDTVVLSTATASKEPKEQDAALLAESYAAVSVPAARSARKGYPPCRE